MMKNHFRFALGRFELQYDTDYGVDNRSGWSVVWDGSFESELEPSLFQALKKRAEGNPSICGVFPKRRR